VGGRLNNRRPSALMGNILPVETETRCHALLD
jgi:hypothetical protein